MHSLKKKHVFLGSVGATVAITLGSHFVQAQYAHANTLKSNPGMDPTCYMESSSGMQIDLQNICGQSSASQLPPLDPNMPIQAPIQLTDKPSELWKTIPDLKTPVQEGKTRPAAPAAPGESAPVEGQSAR